MNALQWLFIGFTLATAAAVVAVVARFIGGRAAAGLLLGLGVWFAYVAVLSRLGILQRADARPPGMLLILLPVITYLLVVVVLSATRVGARVAGAFPLAAVIGFQAFRIVVELFLHRLWIDGVVPRTLTLNGANVDIYVGLSAPVVAVLATRYRRGNSVALVWNVIGLFALANVVVRAIATSPGPLNWIPSDPPNAMFATFPFMFIPAFFVPLAVTLHVVALRIGWDRRHSAIA